MRKNVRIQYPARSAAYGAPDEIRGSAAKPATCGDNQNDVKCRYYDDVKRLNGRLGYANVLRTGFFGQCGVWFLPSPKLALGAPLRRRDARSTKLPRSGADWTRALRRLRAIANQCVDLGRSNLTLRAMRRLVPTLPQAGAWGSIAAPGRALDQITAFRRGLDTGAPTLTGDCKSMR